MNKYSLENISREIRATCVKMAYTSKHGHLKSALTCSKILTYIYFNLIDLEKIKQKKIDRDRFYMSKGHGVSALYSIFAKAGMIDIKELETYCDYNSRLLDHPCKHSFNILESSSGSLGHCLGIATGALYGLSLKKIFPKGIVLMSDGECNEGSVWEAAMFAASKKINNLLVFVDYNGFQAVGKSDEIMAYTSLEEKFKSFGWYSKTINGENFNEYSSLEKDLMKINQPKAIVVKTKTGISFMNNDNLWHYRVPSLEDINASYSELKTNPIF